MARNKKNKSGKSDNSVGSVGDDSVCKAGRFTSTPEQVCVCSVLNEANYVLFTESTENTDGDDTVKLTLETIFNQFETEVKTMATPPTPSTMQIYVHKADSLLLLLVHILRFVHGTVVCYRASYGPVPLTSAP